MMLLYFVACFASIIIFVLNLKAPCDLRECGGYELSFVLDPTRGPRTYLVTPPGKNRSDCQLEILHVFTNIVFSLEPKSKWPYW
ncbi:MAG: hypothetical protein CVU60_01665 [Deltaproteobacteria bacterium HGW-Deltaproteobacteria-18]|nr:MAG: hypothetical protein CVU60_01665 [Deltaproteobacteria bacterium HGW-Deltaproteobacteria-18]